MIKVLTREESRAADEAAIKNGISETELMRRAGLAVFDSFSFEGDTLIVIGKGNNAGDGLQLAKLLREAEKEVKILQLYNITKPAILDLLSQCMDIQIPIYRYNDSFSLEGYDNIVDAILGIGYKGELDDYLSNIIIRLNNAGGNKIAIDINTGLDANNGRSKLAFESDLTIAIGYPKTGLFLNDAKDYISDVTSDTIGIPYTGESVELFLENDLDLIFSKRKKNVHKGMFGYVGIMGGSFKYSGSVKLGNLALSALTSGAGVARIIAPYEICDSIMPYLLEATLYPIDSIDGHFIFNKDQIDDSIKGLSSLALGMGMDKFSDAKLIVEHIIKTFEGRLLIDADGLNALKDLDLEILNNSKAEIVLTPHVKEFSRLINVDTETILDNPVKYAKEFTLKYHVTLLLKGDTTIISDKGNIYFVTQGSPALSKGGSGDILSGIIAGIMGYEKYPYLACCAGSFVLGNAGMLAEDETGDYATLPRDTIEQIKEVMKKY